MEIANTIRARRIVALQAQRAGFHASAEAADKVLFLDFFKKVADSKEGTTRTSWLNALEHIKIYDGRRHLTLLDITPRWVYGFRQYLDKEALQWGIDRRKHNEKTLPLSEGTKALMFQKLTACLNEAVRQIVPIPGSRSLKHLVDNIEAASRTYTAEEMQEIDAALSRIVIKGDRYNANNQANVGK